MASPGQSSSSSWTVTKLPSDFDIFSPSAALRKPLCIETRLAHRRTFDVPAGTAASPPLVLPGAVPARQVRWRRLPQDEIASIALVGRDLDAGAFALLVEILAREPAVIRQRRDREEDVALCLVGEAAFDQRRDHRDHLRDMLGGAR